MVTSFQTTLIIIGILTVPGTFLFYITKKYFRDFNFVDSIVSIFLLSGTWNYLFFLPRLYPEIRKGAYLIGIGILMILALIKLAITIKKLIKKECQFPKLKKGLQALIISLLVLILGSVLMGYPFHKQNLSRLQLNVGGDVEFFLSKTQILTGGYSFMDDFYADQVNFYGNFLMSEVALVTTLTNYGIALNAESFRIILIVIIFWLFYALARGLSLKQSDSLLLALLSLLGYSIWSHIDFYIAASMAFFTSLMFFYFFSRAFIVKKGPFWFMAGLAAGLVIHSHPVHAVFGGIFAFASIAIYMIYQKYKGVKIQHTIHNFLPVLWGPIFWGVIFYIIPLALRYGLKSTSKFYLVEEFDNNMKVFWESLIDIKGYWIAMVISFIVWFKVWKKKENTSQKVLYLLPIIYLFWILFLIGVGVSIFAVKTHRFALYVDSEDFLHLAKVLAWTIVAIVILNTVEFLVEQKLKKTSASINTIVRWMAVIVFFGIIFPPSPIYYNNHKPFISQYGQTIWEKTKLAKAEGIRAVEGNVNDPSWDEFAAQLHEVIPPYTSAVFMTAELSHSFGSHFKRQLVYYEAYAHSNIFLDPPFEERYSDYQFLNNNFNQNNFLLFLRKYKATHVLWTWRDQPDLLREYGKYPYLKQIYANPNKGVLFEIDKNVIKK
ncbi:hypothetical protein HYV56_01200 [Candidatus Peregrinibacteria bacterium]|nr:hypothetical protein [Candidatus Peregrinibacteria bacterium]